MTRAAADDRLGLYLSVPFCRAKCTFCHFASEAYPPERMQEYVARLCADLKGGEGFAAREGLSLPRTVDTVFIGGGTPSLLQPQQMRDIVDAVRSSFAVAADAEITVEAAPGQIAGDLLEAMLACGVNRVSLGVQSFVDAESRAVGRSHTGRDCLSELARLRAAGVPRLSVDLIIGLPHQTQASWRESVEAAIASGVEHVSVYMLEVDGGSKLGRELIGPGVRYSAGAVPHEDDVADMYQWACERLRAAGLPQYEISNFARSGSESRHNMKYWTRAPYLGFGLDAHSMLKRLNGGEARFANSDSLDTYLHHAGSDEVDAIDAEGAWEETVFLGLRMVRGLSVNSLRSSFGRRRVDALVLRARELETDGLMFVGGDCVRLTARGRLLAQSVFGELLIGEAVLT